MRKFLIVLIAISMISMPRANASSGKEFFLSIIYGTLAGTLVGAATLAFTSNPGNNLNNVARGASYGLYAGILLGLYVTYGLGEEAPADPQGGEPAAPTTSIKGSNLKVSLIPYVIPSLTDKKDLTIGAQVLQYRF